MFSRVQTRHFRSLKSIDQALGPMQALVGPNASGKTTFLDVIGLLSDMIRLRGDVRETVLSRSANFDKLIWQGSGASGSFQLAVEAPIPPAVQQRMAPEQQHFNLLRYEIEIGLDSGRNELGLNHETLWLRTASERPVNAQGPLFPATVLEVPTILSRKKQGSKVDRKSVV